MASAPRARNDPKQEMAGDRHQGAEHLDRLTSAERDRSSANLRPKDAATLIIIDRESRTPKS